MYGELASVRGIVDLSPQEALDKAEAFLATQGYVIEQRTYTTVTAQRQAEGGSGEQDLRTIAVTLSPQPDGGVRMTVRGNDQEGIQQRQAPWLEWSESLPKKFETETVEADVSVPQMTPVPTPEADVPVPPLPTSENEGVGELSDAEEDEQSVSTESTNDAFINTFITLAIIFSVIGLIVAIAAKSAGWVVVLVIVLAVIFYRLKFTGPRWEAAGKDTEGRLVLDPGFEEPVSEAERSRLLDEQLGLYMREGFFVRQRTATTAQLVKPKQFSFIWAFLWFLMLGVGLIVYLIYYAAKQDEGRYLEVDEYGTVKATRQIRHVL